MINIGQYIEMAINWMMVHFSTFFDAVNAGIGSFIIGFQHILFGIPFYITILVLAALAWMKAGRGTAIFTALGLLLIYGMGFRSFGATRWQLLYKVQLPLALPTILTGVNQTIMMSLSMVVIAAMIAAGGLGEIVLKGITQMKIGLGFEGGIAVVILAIILDRITQGMAGRKNKN